MRKELLRNNFLRCRLKLNYLNKNNILMDLEAIVKVLKDVIKQELNAVKDELKEKIKDVKEQLKESVKSID